MFGNMLKKMQGAKESFAKLQEELAQTKVEGESGAGMVKVTINGKGEVLDIVVEDSVYAEERQILLDLIKAAINSAKSKLAVKKNSMMKDMMAKFGLPEGANFPFMGDLD